LAMDQPPGVPGVFADAGVGCDCSDLPSGVDSLRGSSSPMNVTSETGVAFPHFPHAAAFGGFSALQYGHRMINVAGCSDSLIALL
jgi:hypothetical protein